MIRLFLVDDHAMLREGLRRQFEDSRDIRICGEAGSARELSARLKGSQADVIILDLNLPDANGITLITEVKKILPSCKVIVLTMYDHVRYAISALESGAEGFVVKGSPFEELMEAVRSVHKGKSFVSADMARRLIGRIRKGATTGGVEQLSEREFEVLTMLSRGMTLKEVAETMNISSKTVTTYRARLMDKLGLTTTSEIIRYAMENDLLK